MKKFLALLCFAPLLFSCEKEQQKQETGTVVFGNDFVSKSTLKGASLDFDSVTHVVLTIVDASDDTVASSEKIELFKVNGQILSYPLELKVGSYQLTDFYLIDANNNIKYVAPKEGSEMAPYVLDPLSISFSISNNDETKTTVEVMSTEEATAAAFGYAEFDASIVETFDIYVAAFVYNDTSNTFDLTSGTLLVNGTNFSITQSLLPQNNIVKIKDGLASYSVSFVFEGDTLYNNSFTNAELKAFEIDNMTPLKIYIKKHTVILQPGAEGKDALVLERLPETNFGSSRKFYSLDWTYHGTVFIGRSFIEFDLTDIPSNAIVKSASLSLYYLTDHPESTGGHSSLSGSNESVLSKITEPWDEDSITWNNQPKVSAVNQAYLPQSISANQDYNGIDVSALIQDMVNNPETNYGMRLSLLTEQHYRCLLFASSDHVDENLRPKLTIEYVY